MVGDNAATTREPTGRRHLCPRQATQHAKFDCSDIIVFDLTCADLVRDYSLVAS